MPTDALPDKLVLHLCAREIVRPLRDQILRISGYRVESTCSFNEALVMFRAEQADLVLVDVAGEEAVNDAERFCSEVKTIHHGQLVAFVCNWRVGLLTDCPDEVLRAEFDPAAFVSGVKRVFAEHQPRV